ncbi:MAG: hypothetical protein R3C11_16920 [Planctomycetaceae bacterium]
MHETSLIDSFQKDFRYQAMRASLDGMRKEQVNDPWEASFSYCLPTGNSPRILRRIYLSSIGTLLMGVILLLSSGGLVFARAVLDLNIPIQNMGLILLTCAGVICLIFFFPLVSWLRAPFFKERGKRCQQQFRAECIPQVTLEDPATGEKTKLAPEDTCYLLLDQECNRLILEGLLCSYQIRAADVILIQFIKSGFSTATLIAVRMGDREKLEIRLSKIPHVNDRPASDGAAHDYLFKRITKTLSTQQSTESPDNQSYLR